MKVNLIYSQGFVNKSPKKIIGVNNDLYCKIKSDLRKYSLSSGHSEQAEIISMLIISAVLKSQFIINISSLINALGSSDGRRFPSISIGLSSIRESSIIDGDGSSSSISFKSIRLNK